MLKSVSTLGSGGGGGTPAGATGDVQYNNAGSFDADSQFTRDPSTLETIAQRTQSPGIIAGYHLGSETFFAGSLNGSWNSLSNSGTHDQALAGVGDFSAFGFSAGAVGSVLQNSVTGDAAFNIIDTGSILLQESVPGAPTPSNPGVRTTLDSTHYFIGLRDGLTASLYYDPVANETIIGNGGARLDVNSGSNVMNIIAGMHTVGVLGVANTLQFGDPTFGVGGGILTIDYANNILTFSGVGNDYLKLDPTAQSYGIGDLGITNNGTRIIAQDSGATQYVEWIAANGMQGNNGVKTTDGNTALQIIEGGGSGIVNFIDIANSFTAALQGPMLTGNRTIGLLNDSGSIALNSASGVIAAQSATATVATYIAPVTAQYRIGAWANITAISANTLQFTVTFTDENGASQSLSMFPVGKTVASFAGIAFWSMQAMDIYVNGGTLITIAASVGGAGSITYDAGSSIQNVTK